LAGDSRASCQRPFDTLSCTRCGYRIYPEARTLSVKGTNGLASEKLAKLCREIALDKKAEDAMILDVRGISNVADFFVICTGTSEPHLKAIANEIDRRLLEEGIRP